MSTQQERCPYGDCTFEGTQEEVDDHCAYMAMIDDEEHQQDRRVR
jgi:hypothetical protein